MHLMTVAASQLRNGNEMDQVNCKLQLLGTSLRQVKTCLVPGIFYTMTNLLSDLKQITNRRFHTVVSLAVLDIWSIGA